LPSMPEDVAGFRVARRFYLWGKWLRYSSLFPTWLVRLVRVGRVRYINRGHGETWEVDGRIESLEHDLIDENHKGMEEWFARLNHYTTADAVYALSQPRPAFRDLFSWDPLQRRAAVKGLGRRLPGTPLWFFLYAYVFRRGFLDGWEG